MKSTALQHGAFQTGDRVVLSPYGVGVIGGTCCRPVGSQTYTYYEINFPNSHSRAYVPVNTPGQAGMRAALTDLELPELLSKLQKSTLGLPRQWSVRQKIVTDLVAGGNPHELAALICEFKGWNRDRGLPDLDRQAYRRAIKLLQQEVLGLNGKWAQQIQLFLEEAWNESPIH